MINLLRCLSDRFIYGTHESFGEILRDTLGITLGSSNSWFIIEIVILYLAFYVLFSLIPDKDLALVLLWIVVAVLIIFGFLRGHDPEGSKGSWFRGEWWYNSTIAFILGTLYGRCRKKVDLFIQKRYALLLAAAAPDQLDLAAGCLRVGHIRRVDLRDADGVHVLIGNVLPVG